MDRVDSEPEDAYDLPDWWGCSVCPLAQLRVSPKLECQSDECIAEFRQRLAEMTDDRAYNHSRTASTGPWTLPMDLPTVSGGQRAMG